MTNIAVDPDIITTLLNAALDYGEKSRLYARARSRWVFSDQQTKAGASTRSEYLHADLERASAQDYLLRTALTCTDRARADILAQLHADATTTPEGERA